MPPLRQALCDALMEDSRSKNADAGETRSTLTPTEAAVLEARLSRKIDKVVSESKSDIIFWIAGLLLIQAVLMTVLLKWA